MSDGTHVVRPSTVTRKRLSVTSAYWPVPETNGITMGGDAAVITRIVGLSPTNPTLPSRSSPRHRAGPPVSRVDRGPT